MHISPKGQQFRKEVQECVKRALRLEGRIKIGIVANPPDRRKRDIDNIIKPLLDSLTKAGVWLDDSQIDRLEIVRTNDLSGCVTVIVEEIQ